MYSLVPVMLPQAVSSALLLPLLLPQRSLHVMRPREDAWLYVLWSHYLHRSFESLEGYGARF